MYICHLGYHMYTCTTSRTFCIYLDVRLLFAWLVLTLCIYIYVYVYRRPFGEVSDENSKKFTLWGDVTFKFLNNCLQRYGSKVTGITLCSGYEILKEKEKTLPSWKISVTLYIYMWYISMPQFHCAWWDSIPLYTGAPSIYV